MGTRRSVSILSPPYLMVQGQTHLELTQSNSIHSKCKTTLSRRFLLIFIPYFQDPRVPNPIISGAASYGAICKQIAIGAALLLPNATQCSGVEHH